MARISISFDLDQDGRYDALVRRLRQHEAFPVLPTQWMLLTPLTVDEIRGDLQSYINPSDRLLVTQVASMSSRNLIDDEGFERGAA
jgi:hypothetical protein